MLGPASADRTGGTFGRRRGGLHNRFERTQEPPRPLVLGQRVTYRPAFLVRVERGGHRLPDRLCGARYENQQRAPRFCKILPRDLDGRRLVTRPPDSGKKPGCAPSVGRRLRPRSARRGDVQGRGEHGRHHRLAKELEVVSLETNRAICHVENALLPDLVYRTARAPFRAPLGQPP